MAVHVSHASLPYPVLNARYSLALQMLASTTGIPTDPVTPTCAVSKDNAAFGAAAETPVVMGSGKGDVLTTFSGAEMNCALLTASFSGGSGPTIANQFLQPRMLPILFQDTAQAGTATSITLAGATPAIDLRGCIVRTTGGTGGGGAGGANNQARVILAYNAATRVATVWTWEVTVDVTTTYDLLITEIACGFLRPAAVGGLLDIDALMNSLNTNVLTAGMLQRAR